MSMLLLTVLQPWSDVSFWLCREHTQKKKKSKKKIQLELAGKTQKKAALDGAGDFVAEIFGTGVSAQVARDHVAAAGGVGALRAAVGLLARVRPLVGAQMVRTGKDLTARPTRVRLETGVQPHVPREHVAARERPLAHLALVSFNNGGWRCGGDGVSGGGRHRLVPGSQVFNEPVVDVEALAADLATKRSRRVAYERGGH